MNRNKRSRQASLSIGRTRKNRSQKTSPFNGTGIASYRPRRALPLSGTEPTLDMEQWVKPTVGNCMSAAYFDPLNRPGLEKAQPGDRAGLSHIPLDLSTCEISKRILADNPGNVYKVRAEAPCEKGFHKVFVFNDPDKVRGDFHLYGQFKDLVMRITPGMTKLSLAKKYEVHVRNVIPLGDGRVMLKDVGLFFHKLGYAPGGALLEDSCGRLIKDPRRACRFVGSRVYSKSCGAFCARSGVAKTRVDSNYA